MKRAVLLLLSVLAVSIPALAVSPGEHLAYVVGCINCHHQTPKDIINAPPLLIVKTYTLQEFRSFLKTGITRTGRDLPKASSIMGIVALEQFSHMSEGEVQAIYAFVTREWTAERAAREEAKIPVLYAADKARAKK